MIQLLLSLGVTAALPVGGGDLVSRSFPNVCQDVNDSPKPTYVAVQPSPITGPIQPGSLQGVSNFRDYTSGVKNGAPFNDISTSSGKQLKHGIIYRSNQLSNATDADISTLGGANITRDFDFRLFIERATGPDRVFESTEYVVDDVLGPCNGLGVDGSILSQLGSDVVETLESFANGTFSLRDNIVYSTMYKAMAVYEGANVAYHRLFHDIAYESTPIVYHCTAGKDRTGVATAYLHRILGVDLDTINDAYLASNYYLGESDAVKQEYLQATWDVIDQVWGNFDNFVKKGLKLDENDIKALQDKLLE